MGSPVSMVVADITMWHLENLAFKGIAQHIKYFCRYVDDIFIVYDSNLDDILLAFNSVNKRLQFTVEKEQEGKLAFLDVLVKRGKDENFEFSVHRKPTDTGTLWDYDSGHAKSHK